MQKISATSTGDDRCFGHDLIDYVIHQFNFYSYILKILNTKGLIVKLFFITKLPLLITRIFYLIQ